MKLPISLDIAKTHMLSRKRQTFVAMMGVTFGIGMFIALVGLMNGLNDLTEELSMSALPDIRIFNDVSTSDQNIIEVMNPDGWNIVHSQKPKNESTKLRNGFQILHFIQQDPRVAGASPLLTSQVFFNYGPVKLNASIMGVDILQEDKLFDLASKMREGNIRDLLTTNDGIILGRNLAKKLNAKPGDRVQISTPEGFTTRLKVVGIVQFGMGAVDDVRSYANLSTVQRIMGRDNRYMTEINVKMKELEAAPAVAREYEKLFGYKAEDWETANATVLVGKIIRNIMSYAVTFTLLLVAGFGIYNILNMTIMNKIKDIAILKATGFNARDIRHIFMTQSLIIGLLGSVLGLMLGYALSLLISRAPLDLGDALATTHFPVNFDITFYVIGIVFGVITTSLAGFLPSRKAGSIDPIEIIRGQ
ncbi:MAG: ABC transporter permease [Cyclobacteriaceae bacterium]|nr:ABC transporter permease [Cyclobacteriaceae bacterium]